MDNITVTFAHWTEYLRPHYFKCSNCKGVVPYAKAMIRADGTRAYNYCPYCGAKMM